MKKIKSLGQHFLRDEDVAWRIVNSLQLEGNKKSTVVEIGPGEGVLTKYLTKLEEVELFVVETGSKTSRFIATKIPLLNQPYHP